MNHPAPSRPRPRHRLAGSVALAAALAMPATTALAASTASTHPTAATEPIAVSAQDPPPDLLLYPFAQFTLPEGLVASWDLSAAVTDDGGAYVIDDSAGVAYEVRANGAVFAPITLDAVPSFPVAGPGGLLYGLTFDDATQELAISATPMTGATAGTVVASTPVSDRAQYVELPIGVFGNANSGIVDRSRNVGAVMTPHITITGEPVRQDGYPDILQFDGSMVSSIEGSGVLWPLAIERDPEYSPGVASAGDSPPVWIAPGSTAAFWTAIGKPASVDGPPTMPVVAFLNADGTGEWFSIPDDWTVASADIGGLLFIRQLDGGMVQVARVGGGGGSDAVEVAADPCPDYTPNADEYPVQLCDEGDGVRAVQTALGEAGYFVVVDGFFGPNTQAAVRKFQRSAGLEVDGLAGPDTWAALQESFPQEGTDDDASGVVDPWEIPPPPA